MTDFSDDFIKKVWEKGKIVQGANSDMYRKDELNAWIKRDNYARKGIPLSFGWSIGYIKPLDKGGNKTIDNMRPLQWENVEGLTNENLPGKVTSSHDVNMYEAEKMQKKNAAKKCP